MRSLFAHRRSGELVPVDFGRPVEILPDMWLEDERSG
jgi:hypothetical protein